MAYGLTQSLDVERGSSQYASATDSASLSITGDITAEAWIKVESFEGGGTPYPIVGKQQSSINNGGWLLNVEDIGGGTWAPGFQVSGGSGNATARGDAGLSTGTWYHIAGTWTAGSGNSPKVYVNGVEVSYSSQTTGQSAILDSGEPTTIGGSNSSTTPSRFADGLTSLVRVWSVVRSEANIAANMCNVLGATASLAAEWTLDNTDNDNSGNSNTLTRAGGAAFVSDVPATCAVVGPANLKSLDTNLKANIKSYNTNPLANIKSINTNA